MLINKFFQKGRDFLGCKLPIMCGAMTWISDYKLISAIGEAGGFGLLAGGNTPIKIFEDEIIKTREYTDKPFGVNLIVIAPVYHEQLQLVCDLKCEVVIFAGSIPKESEIKKAQDAGAKTICFAPTAPLALRLIKMGVDAIMLEGSEAGGHIGPVSLSVLIQQILFEVEDVPIIMAGGIATGKMMAHLLMMGAAGIQMGTLLLCLKSAKPILNLKRLLKRQRLRMLLLHHNLTADCPLFLCGL